MRKTWKLRIMALLMVAVLAAAMAVSPTLTAYADSPNGEETEVLEPADEETVGEKTEVLETGDEEAVGEETEVPETANGETVKEEPEEPEAANEEANGEEAEATDAADSEKSETVPVMRLMAAPSQETAAATKWETSKSKTAEATDTEDVYDVTLSLPAAEENLNSDIVFVLDNSSCNQATANMFADLLDQLLASKNESGASIKIAVVSFKGVAHYNFELSELTDDSKQAILDAVKVKPDSSGSNIEVGLAKAQEILAADSEVEDFRKYVVLLSDGTAYQFLHNGERSTVWVKFDNPQAGLTSWGLPKLGVEGSYAIPGGDWDTYWQKIQTWVANDGSAYIQSIDKANIDQAKVISRNEAADHALCVDWALYNTWVAYSNLQDAGYHCYAMDVGDGSRPIGVAFMNMLNGNSTLDFSTIENDILYLLDKGSTVDDYMGYDESEGYDFDFVDEAEKLTLKVGEASYEAVKLDPEDGATSTYGFKPDENSGYAFKLSYFKGDGKAEEHFTWTINEAVSNFAPVSLTYQVELVEKNAAPGKHEADTNQSATLTPVDSNGEPGDPEEFEKPTVPYTTPAEPVDSSVTDQITIKKTMTGRDLEEGEFTFEMKDSEGEIVAEASNDADGNVVFPAVTFTEAGEFNYTVTEKKGSDSSVTYSNLEAQVTATVTEETQEDTDSIYLNVEWTAGDLTEIEFINEYVPGSASVQIHAVKKLTGRELKDGEFSFELKDENGKVIATASNKADGSVVFPELIYQEVGTYKYTVSEVKGNAENVTYDTSVKAVTVTVTDDGKGSLSAKAEPADVTFNNVFTPKQTPADTPRTGDDSRIALYGVLAILSLMGIVGCAIVGRRHADR